MKSLYSLLIFLLAVVVSVAFFLPWLNVESKPLGSVSKILTGKSQGTLDNINAFRIPILANGAEARFMISVIKIFSPEMRNAPTKSFFVWILPLLAVLIFGASYFFPRSRLISLTIGIAGITVFTTGLYKISITDLDRLMLTVYIGHGLWLTLYAYLTMGLIGWVRFTQLSIRAKRRKIEELRSKKWPWKIKTVSP
ncbi:MAG: hypothetical protein KJ593_04895 [Candidatus Omnitrophica bacterium]|nr:hypothetical protein [Candidatus Omnitrophota bacterium]